MNSCKCGKRDNLQLCSACKGIFYCSRDHQKDDWKSHKETCGFIKQAVANGFHKQIHRKGDPTQVPTKGKPVKVSYRGYFPNGVTFDQSGEFRFNLGMEEVIKGWDEGVATMCVGEKATFYLSAPYAYGSSGAPPTIPPEAPLVFDVELLEKF
eukprot:TRINITY_DN15075_c0_g1_i1.p1 TRINITY_DN15075_c0_g1~~TRINITY_DN15075_c0_g1_i1.p1  ORF type:complete len:153 (-),score=31.95 TRINITY_DN15075_c0_g1_i1:36-494(-)